MEMEAFEKKQQMEMAGFEQTQEIKLLKGIMYVMSSIICFSCSIVIVDMLKNIYKEL